jgi:hypothetical protein
MTKKNQHVSVHQKKTNKQIFIFTLKKQKNRFVLYCTIEAIFSYLYTRNQSKHVKRKKKNFFLLHTVIFRCHVF